MNDEEVERLLFNAVRKNSPKGSDVAFDAETNLLRTGVLDSVSIFEMVADIEIAAGRPLPESEILPENFETIRKLKTLYAKAAFPKGH